MIDILLTYDKPVPLSYGAAYHLAAEKLQDQGVTHAHLDLRRFVSTYDFSADYLEEAVAEHQPKLILSHHRSLETSLGNLIKMDIKFIPALMEEIETFFVRNYLGRIQTDSAYFAKEHIEFKEGFVRQMRKHGLPHPKSILRDEVGDENWNYEYLRKQLAPENGHFLIKDISLQKSRGITMVESPDQMLYWPNVRVAQQFLKSQSPIPGSLRITTFSDKIMGALLVHNFDNNYLSNAIFSDLLTLNVDNGSKLTYKKNSYLINIFHYFGINPDLTIREDIIELAKKVAGITSQSLVRGIDVIFDEQARPYFIEAQTGPGNPSQSSYPLMCGLKPKKNHPDYNLNIAAEVLSKYMLRFLQQN
jgi:hypothetical protein